MLDKSLPHGSVHGMTNGITSYQFGKYYDAEGYECDFKTGERIERKPTPPPKVRPVEPVEVEPVEGDGEPTDDVIAKNGVNLSAWARGEASDVSIAKVKNAVEEIFGRRPKDADEALKIIAGQEIDG